MWATINSQHIFIQLICAALGKARVTRAFFEPLPESEPKRWE
jgi:hypothetical protein